MITENIFGTAEYVVIKTESGSIVVEIDEGILDCDEGVEYDAI